MDVGVILTFYEFFNSYLSLSSKTHYVRIGTICSSIQVVIDYKRQVFTGKKSGNKLVNPYITMVFKKVGGTWRLAELRLDDVKNDWMQVIPCGWIYNLKLYFSRKLG